MFIKVILFTTFFLLNGSLSKVLQFTKEGNKVAINMFT